MESEQHCLSPASSPLEFLESHASRGSGEPKSHDDDFDKLDKLDVKAKERSDRILSPIEFDVHIATPPDEALIRQIRLILNKMTNKKFQTLLSQALELTITAAHHLRDLAASVFTVALSQCEFSPVYAEFSRQIEAKLPTFKSKPQLHRPDITFKRLLLTLCIREFTKEIERKHPFDVTNVDEMNEKKKMLATVKFIGELHVRRLIPAKRMDTFIRLLLGDIEQPDQHRIEALCVLFRAIGRSYDKNQPEVESTFSKLLSLSLNHKLLPARGRFMIQDLLEFRASKWVAPVPVSAAPAPTGGSSR
jgi:hypothetical protein